MRSELASAIPLAGVMLLATGSLPLLGQQLASTVETPRTVDRDFDPQITTPAYPGGAGPRVLIDEAHRNFHTAVGTYWPFSRVLEADGYVVERGSEAIAAEALESYAVFVIADAQPPEHLGEPATFSSTEVVVLNRWVRNGGALLLITDHMPDPGAIAELAGSFGIEVHNGYALEDALSGRGGPMIFRDSDGTLVDHPLTRGRQSSEAVGSVATFAGAALRAAPPFQPLLLFGADVESWQPEEYWQFSTDTPRIDVAGWSQGGILEYGEGRVAVFGEAAMFTAQIFPNGRRVGMSHPRARGNLRLLRNVMLWLSGAWPQE